MAKVAKLVYSSFVTRVIVDDDANDDDIAIMAISKLSDELSSNGINIEAIDSIEDDAECPYSDDEDEISYVEDIFVDAE